jgi:hypothetical protein
MTPDQSDIIYLRVIKIKTNWVIVFLGLPWLLLLLGMLGFMGFGLITGPSHLQGLWVFWIIILVIGIIALNRLLWNMIGREIVSVSPKGITVSRKGKFFTSSTTISYVELDEIYSDDDPDTPHWRKFWRIGGGKVVIKYLGIEKRIGPSLSLSFAERIAEEIRKAVEIAKEKTE